MHTPCVHESVVYLERMIAASSMWVCECIGYGFASQTWVSEMLVAQVLSVCSALALGSGMLQQAVKGIFVANVTNSQSLVPVCQRVRAGTIPLTMCHLVRGPPF
jgi:hypothetical protein